MENITNAEWETFVKGFNDGYLIAEHEPQIAKPLVVDLQNNPTLQDNPFFDGLTEGILLYELEKVKERYHGYQSPDRGSSPDKEKGRTKD